MWIVCITSVRHVLTVNGYGGRQTKENEKSWCFKGWETLVKEDILFDETHGVLHYHRHRIELANQRLKLFCILLEHKGYFIESDQLKEEIWPDGSVSKDALTATAKRLKEDLSPIPGLVIESARGKGYSLKIVSGE